MKAKKLVVIGGGAAGFFCAVNAARLYPQLSVTIVEKTNKVLSKVKVSGGGRCNTTHACFEVPELIKRYPRGTNFLKKSFYQFSTRDTIEWFEERGVVLHTESDGRMFPTSNNSQSIIDCLLKEADKYGVEVRTKVEVQHIEKGDQQFSITTASGEQLITDFLCVATGGFPKAAMFDWLTKSTNHTIVPPVPSLFTFNIPKHPITQLMGISVPLAQVKIAGTKLKETGPLLITHWGLSGPVVLKLSAWGARELAEKNYRFTILVNWLGDVTEQGLRESWNDYRMDLSAQKIGSKNPFQLPARLWIYLLQASGIGEESRWGELKSIQQQKLIQLLIAAEFLVEGKTTFKEEFVTCGGIQLSEIDANTMMSKKVDGLYFAGEVLDVDGITGGFNFQNAWTGGWVAAKAIGDIVK